MYMHIHLHVFADEIVGTNYLTADHIICAKVKYYLAYAGLGVYNKQTCSY